MPRITYDRLEREFEQLRVPLVGTLKRSYVSQEDPNYPNRPGATAEFYVKRKDIRAILEGRLRVFPIIQIKGREEIMRNDVRVEAIFDADISGIVADFIRKNKQS